MEYVYLLQEREFVTHDEPVYKIGRTAQLNFIRFNQYPKNSKSYFQSYCGNCQICEKLIIDLFSVKYIRRVDIGSEYFEGDVCSMIIDICTILSNYLTSSRNKTQDAFERETKLQKKREREIEREKEREREIEIERKQRVKKESERERHIFEFKLTMAIANAKLVEIEKITDNTKEDKQIEANRLELIRLKEFEACALGRKESYSTDRETIVKMYPHLMKYL